MVLLKEHKIPRGSFSSSNENNSNLAKNKIRTGTDDHQQMSSSLGKIQTMGDGKGSGSGKRPTWPSSSREEREREREREREQERSSSQSSSDQQHQQQSRRRRHHGAGREHGHGHGHSNNVRTTTRHEVPGGKFSGSDLDDHDHDHDYSSDSSSDDRDLVRHHDHDRPRRPSMVRRNSRNQPERGPGLGAEVPSTVSRSSAARNHSSSPKYSSSWPLQRSSHYDRDPRQAATRQHRIIHEEPEQIEEAEMDYDHHAAPEHGYGHGYESGDESDDIFSGEFEFDETTHRRMPRRPPSPPPAAPASIAPTDSISRRGERMHHDRHHQYSSSREQQHQQVLHRQPSQHLEPIHHDDDRDRPRRRAVKPPRPPIARTVVSHRPSMGALDQGIDTDRAGAYASSTTDIWRGRPEDWESPYSSSSDHEDDGGYDDGYYGRGQGGGDDAPAYDYGYDQMMLLEGDRHRSRAPSHVNGYNMHMPRSSSPQLLPPRRSGDLKSVFSLGFNARRELSPVGTHLSRRTRAGDAADEHTSSGGFLMPPAPSTRGGGSGRRGAAGTRRAPSPAATERSRWTVMVPEYDVSDYGYSYGGNDYGVAYSSPPPAPAPTTIFEEEEEGDGLEGYYSYGFAPSIHVQAPSPPLRLGGRKPPACAMTEEEEMEYGYGGEGYGRASGGLLSPVPTRTAAARFNFDKSWSELSRLLL